MDPDQTRIVRELLDHCAASVERMTMAVRRGLHPAALAECEAQLVGQARSLAALAATMAERARQAEGKV